MEKVNGVLTFVTEEDLELLNSNPKKFWKGVTTIGDCAFNECKNLTQITIPAGVENIGEWAFSESENLTQITIPASVTSIGFGAFMGCDKLQMCMSPNNEYAVLGNCLIDKNRKEIIFGNALSKIPNDGSVTSVGYGAFGYCENLTNIDIPNSVINIANLAFGGCKNLTKINIPSSVTSIGDEAFFECENLTRIDIPASVTSIGKEVFSTCKNLTQINIPISVKSIEQRAFNRCENLTQITIPAGVTSLGHGAFYRCKNLTHINIPSSVTSIGQFAFGYCENLTQIDIPDSVTTIGANAFNHCDKLTVINLVNNKNVKSKFPYAFFDALYFEQVKRLCKNREEPLNKKIDTLCKKCNIDKNSPSYVELYKLCFNLGMMELPTKTISYGGKSAKVSDVAYTLMQGILNKGLLNYDDLHANLSSLQEFEYNEGLLKFLVANKANAEDLIQHMDRYVSIDNWFRGRNELELNAEVQASGDVPTTEQNRYRVCSYTESEDGVYREHWNAPTIELIIKELDSKVFNKITEKTRPIADELIKHGYREQKFFDKAVKINAERERLVQQGKLRNNILNKPIKQDLVEAVEQYKKATAIMENKIVDNLVEVTANLADSRSHIFTYEMLDKSSAENFVMGNLTTCCARLFGTGAGAQRAMIIHPDMQPLVLRDAGGKIVAFSILYVNREEGYAVLNDVEMDSKYDNSQNQKHVKEIYSALINGVNTFTDQYNRENPNKPITLVQCGVSPRTGNTMNDYIKNNPKGPTLQAVNFDRFRYVGSGSWSGDWFGNQYVLLDKTKEGKNER